MTALKRCSATVSSRSTLPTSSPRRWSAKHKKDGRSCQPSTGTLEPISRYQHDKHQPDQHSSVRAQTCQQICQQQGLTTPHAAPCHFECHPPAEQRGYEATRGCVLRCERLARQWHARGQGFKSPQLHPRSEALSAVDRPANPGARAADTQQPPCVADAVIQGGVTRATIAGSSLGRSGPWGCRRRCGRGGRLCGPSARRYP